MAQPPVPISHCIGTGRRRCEAGSLLPAAHAVGRAAPVELRSAFAETEDGRIPGEELHNAGSAGRW